jgi:uncharacterized protein (DUF1697 family)
MERYVAFLRGMNLGGRRITNEELRKRFAELDLTDVSCFRASGNVIFATEEGDEATLTTRIETGLGESLGYEVPVFLRNAGELKAIAAHELFDASLLAGSKGKLQVAFLSAKPPITARKRALAQATAEDRLAVRGRELYWLPSGGVSESELDLKAIESLIGPWTMRTKGTIDQIVTKRIGTDL